MLGKGSWRAILGGRFGVRGVCLLACRLKSCFLEVKWSHWEQENVVDDFSWMVRTCWFRFFDWVKTFPHV